jgi:outer membrane protein TolC
MSRLSKPETHMREDCKPRFVDQGGFVMKAAVLAAVVLAAAPGVRAQAPQTPPASQATAVAMPTVEFDDAIQRALDKNPTIAGAATTISRAEALLEQARAVTLPSVSAALSSATLNTGVSFSGLVAQPRTQVTMSATAAMPVLAAATWAAVTQSRDQITVSKLSVAETRQQVAVAAAQSYLAVIAANRQVDVEQRALTNAQAHLDYADKRLQGGVGSRLDQVRAAQVVSSEQARLENSRLALLTSQEALGVLLAEDGPVDVGAEPTFDVPATIDESTWMANRPDVQFQNASISAAQRVVQDSWKDWLPTGTASFTPQVITPTSVFQKSRSWRFTVAFTQPVFEGGQRKAEAALRRVTLDQSRIQLTAIEIQARSEVRLAQASLQSYERALASARQAADQANQVLSITTSAFELGATTNLEVIDAERSARDAATTAALAEDSVRRARLDLLVALGRFPK